MPNPSPDPTRPSAASHPAAAGPTNPDGAPPPAAGSTGSHRPAPPPQALTDVLRGGSSSARRNAAADIADRLANGSGSHVPLPADAPASSDDAPTVITNNRPGQPPAPPPPPYVVGEVPSIAGRRL